MYRIGRRVVTCIAQQYSRQIRQVGKRFASRVERSAQVGDPPGGMRSLRLSKALTGCEQPIECLAMPPVELVDGPR